MPFGTPAGYNYIAPSNQVWFIKELFNLLGLIGIFIFIVPFAAILLKTPFFKELQAVDIRPANPGPSDTKGKLVFAAFKTVLLALSIITGIYVITFFADWAFATDFRFWVIAVKAFNPETLVYALIYMLPFILFYIVNSAVVNGFNRIDSLKGWRSIVFTCIGNVAGILIMIVIQYVTLISKGLLIWNPMRVFNLLPLVVLIPVATIISRKLFRLTGNIYLGGICMGIFYTIMIVANTMFRGSLFLG
jgi:hypothetical protein